MRGEIWIVAAALSVAANASFAAFVATREPPQRPAPPPIEMRLAAPPKRIAKIDPPPPPLPPPPKPQLVKKIAPKPIAPAPQPPPEIQKVGIDPDTSSHGDLTISAGSTSEGEVGTGNTTDKTPPAPPEPPTPAPKAKPAGKHFVPIFQVTRMPKPKHAVSPEIPEAFRDAQREALVVIEVELDEQGRVTGARVIRHAEFGLDDAALAAAKQTDFEPALVGNQPVPVRYQIPYRFRVRG